MKSEDITGGLDLLGDWLDAKGYTEEAGLCTKAMDEINALQAELIAGTEWFSARASVLEELAALRAENARLREALKDADTAYSLDLIIALRAENKRLREALKRLYHASENISEDVRMTSDEVFRWHNELDAARAAMGESDEQ